MSTESSVHFAEMALSNVPFRDITYPLSQRNTQFGGQESRGTEKIDYRCLSIAIGNKPLCWRVRDVFKDAELAIPSDLELYDEFDVWMICYAVSAVDRGEYATFFASTVDTIGYVAEFDPAIGYTVSLLPEPRMVRNVGGELRVAVDIGLEGLAKAPGVAIGFQDINLVPGLKMQMGVGVNLFAKLDFSVWTPQITTAGICASRSEWIFNRSDKPLLNTQLMFQTLLVPAGLSELSLKAKAYALIRSVGYIPIPSRFETSWLELKVRPVGSVVKRTK